MGDTSGPPEGSRAAVQDSGEKRSGDFRVIFEPKVPLLDGPEGNRVAVAPTGTLLHGLAVQSGHGLWLRIELAEGNPLKERKGLDTVWTCIRESDTSASLLEWEGPMDADLEGPIFKVCFTVPFLDTSDVSYAIESKADGIEWVSFWKSVGSGMDPIESGRVSLSSNWPHFSKKVGVRIVAKTGDGEARLISSPFTVNAMMVDLRCLDKGVPHLRKMKGELAILRRKAEKNGGSDPEQLAQIVEYAAEVDRALKIRAAILARGTPYVRQFGDIDSRKFVLLGGRQDARPQKSSRKFSKALVMGLYHSCTNAIQKELEKRFLVEVSNDWHTGKEGNLWKHRVNENELQGIGDDCLIVLMVKEPYFWLKSCCREPRNWFELHPFTKNEKGEREDIPENKKTMADLFSPLEHDTIIYPNAVAIWNDVVRSYFNDSVYSPNQSVIIRCEDFQFRFHEVMDQLAAFGLSDREQGDRPEPLADRAKGHFECRTRDQALQFYADRANRTSLLTPEQISTVAHDLDQELLLRLRYGGSDPVSTWT